MTKFVGSERPVELGGGFAIGLPGVRGRLRVHGARRPGTRSGGAEQALPALDDALSSAGVEEERSIEIDIERVVEDSSGRSDRSATPPVAAHTITLTVPDRGESTGQIVMVADEHGVVTWHFPVDDRGEIEPSTKRGSNRSKRFEIPVGLIAPSTSAEGGTGKRGLLAMAGKKVVKILFYRTAEALLGVAAEHFATKWESSHRPANVRTVERSNLGESVKEALSPDQWRRVAAGRALLFVHGTFSTTQAAFFRLPEATLDRLVTGYGGRVIAYDHPTLSVDPLRNARDFRDLMPPDVALDVDVVCHSRGGLVARSLAALADDSIRVGSIVFVGAPNAGTQLASPKRIGDMLDRISTLLNLVPDGPQAVVTEILGAVLAALKVIGVGATRSLEGLASMDPDGAFLRGQIARAAFARGYAVTADYEPRASLASLFSAGGAADAAVDGIADRVFQGAPNDLVIPTRGVFEATADSGFPIGSNRVLAFPGARGVAHSDYFAQPETSAKLLEWLAEGTETGEDLHTVSSTTARPATTLRP